MTTKKLFSLFSVLLSMTVTNALAYDIEAKNSDGITIYYNYTNNRKDSKSDRHRGLCYI